MNLHPCNRREQCESFLAGYPEKHPEKAKIREYLKICHKRLCAFAEYNTRAGEKKSKKTQKKAVAV